MSDLLEVVCVSLTKEAPFKTLLSKRRTTSSIGHFDSHPSLFLCGDQGCSTVLKEREAWEFVKALGTVLPSKFLEFRKLPHLTDVSSQLSSHFLFFLDPVSRVVHEGESSCCQVVPCLFSAFPFCTLSYAML